MNLIFLTIILILKNELKCELILLFIYWPIGSPENDTT